MLNVFAYLPAALWQQRHDFLRRLSLVIALVIVALEVLAFLAGLHVPLTIKLIALLFYILATLPQQRWLAKAFALTAAVVILVEGPAQIEEELSSSLFLMSFFFSLTLMASSAARSPHSVAATNTLMSREVSQVYLPLGFMAHVFGLALNLGSISIFMSLLGSRDKQLDAKGNLRPLALAVIRGFGAVPMWAPFSISVALILSLVKDIHYLDLMPAGLSMAAFSIALGWYMEYGFTGRSGSGEGSGSGKAIAFLLLRLLFLGGFAWLLEWWLDLRFVQAILLSALAGGFLWWLTAPRRQTVKGEGSQAAQPGAGLANEIVIIFTAAFLGKWLSSVISVDLADAGVSQVVSNVLVATLPLGMIVAGYLGCNPIVSCSILGGILLPLTTPEQHYYLAVSMLAGWGAAASGAPFAGSVLMASRLIHRSPLQLTLRWNGPFILIFVTFVGLALLLAQFFVM